MLNIGYIAVICKICATKYMECLCNLEHLVEFLKKTTEKGLEFGLLAC